MTAERPSDPGDSADSTVVLRVPASSAFVAVLRSLAAGLAARCDLTLDEIEDLRIAVDEACALLLPLAAPGEVLTAEFGLSLGELVVRVQVATGDDGELRRDGFGWTVLEALVSEVATERAPGSMTITLTKRRESADR